MLNRYILRHSSSVRNGYLCGTGIVGAAPCGCTFVRKVYIEGKCEVTYPYGDSRVDSVCVGVFLAVAFAVVFFLFFVFCVSLVF